MSVPAIAQRRWASVKELQEMGLQLNYRRRTRGHCWSLTVEQEQVSILHVYRISRHFPWEIGYVETHEKWRRMGLAASLYQHAVDVLGAVDHDPSRTIEGNAWANAVGGHLPPWNWID